MKSEDNIRAVTDLPSSLSPASTSLLLTKIAAAAPSPVTAPLSTPLHVIYGGAHLYKKGSGARLAEMARASMETYGKDDRTFAKLVGSTNDAITAELAARVREKLSKSPIEKRSIDFEDGYGPRPDDEEDADAVRAATDLAADPTDTIVGIRIKALDHATAPRAIRTLDAFVTTLAKATGGKLPAGFSVTLPKITRPREVAILAELLTSLETSLGIETPIGIELMIETPSALINRDGQIALPGLVKAAAGRAVAVHTGAYDLTASLGISASEQRLDHPACDAARMLMQISLAGTGVDVFDGAMSILPIPSHKTPETPEQRAENENDVHSAWALHAKSIRHALTLGIYSGWDLHPAQIPARLGAVQAFFLAERKAMSARLRSFVEKATKATRSGRVFDDAATGQGLVEFFLRGVACGALTEDDVKATTLSLDELRARSFAKIVASRT